MKYYICMYFKCVSEKGNTYYSVTSFGTDIEFTKEAYNEVIGFIKESVGKAVKEKIIDCETVFKEEYDRFQKEEKVVEVNLLEVQE